jgi:hypothetical protein
MKEVKSLFYVLRFFLFAEVAVTCEYITEVDIAMYVDVSFR